MRGGGGEGRRGGDGGEGGEGGGGKGGGDCRGGGGADGRGPGDGGGARSSCMRWMARRMSLSRSSVSPTRRRATGPMCGIPPGSVPQTAWSKVCWTA